MQRRLTVCDLAGQRQKDVLHKAKSEDRSRSDRHRLRSLMPAVKIRTLDGTDAQASQTIVPYGPRTSDSTPGCAQDVDHNQHSITISGSAQSDIPHTVEDSQAESFNPEPPPTRSSLSTPSQSDGNFTSQIPSFPLGIQTTENSRLDYHTSDLFPNLIPRRDRSIQSQSFPHFLEYQERINLQDAITKSSDLIEIPGRLQPPIDPLALPDMYMNFLWPSRTSLFTAGLQNAITLGITVQDLMTPKYRSPFYRPTSPADDPSTLVALASNLAFPLQLQPTLPQILFPHHAFLDLIPLPNFRARAISLGAAIPRLFNAIDLKIDVVGNEGIRYIGVTNGGCIVNGDPWDVRSWKVEPWFLKKWRLLLVDENHGLEA